MAGEARSGRLDQAACDLRATCNFLGIDLDKGRCPRNSASINAAGSTSARSNSLIDARNAARKSKDFKESDRIRDELKAMGVVLKDSKDGTTWEIAR